MQVDMYDKTQSANNKIASGHCTSDSDSRAKMTRMAQQHSLCFMVKDSFERIPTCIEGLNMLYIGKHWTTTSVREDF